MVKRNFYDCLKYVDTTHGSSLDIALDSLFTLATKSPRDGDGIESRAQCYGILLFILLPVFNLCLLSILIVFEIKSRGLHLRTLADSKNQVIVTLTVLQVLIFIHYSMAEDVARVFF